VSKSRALAEITEFKGRGYCNSLALETAHFMPKISMLFEVNII